MAHAHTFQIWPVASRYGSYALFVGRGARALVCALVLMVAFLGTAMAQENESDTDGEPATVLFTAREENGYARLIFEFKDRFVLPGYEVNSENGVLVVEFDEVVKMTLPLTSTIMGKYVSVMRTDPGGHSVRLGLVGQFRVNQIEAGERLFIDMLPMNWQGLAPSLPSEVVAQLAERSKQAARLTEQRIRAEIARENAPKVKIRVGRHPTFTRLVFDWSFPTKMKISNKRGKVDVDFEWPADINLGDFGRNLPNTVISASANRDNDGTHVNLVLAPGAEANIFTDSETRYLLDIYSPEEGADLGVDLAMLEEQILEHGQANIEEENPSDTVDEVVDDEENAEEALPASAQTKIKPFVTEIGDTVRIVFPFDQDTPAAVFERAGMIWLLFDTHVGIDKSDLEAPLSELVDTIEVDATTSVQIMRMRQSQERLATLGSEGHSWVLSLGDILFAPTEPVRLERRHNLDGLFEATANLARPSRIHSLRDPNVGDVIKVVTSYPPARGFIRPLEFVEFQIGKTVHGMVIKRYDDDVKVSLEQENVVISRPDGLSLSAGVKRGPRDTLGKQRIGQIRLSDFIEPDLARLISRGERLLSEASESEAESLEEKRIELATLYVANRLGAEALGVLRTLERDLAPRKLNRISMTLMAGANIEMHRFKEAVDNLSAPELLDDPDAAIWRAMAAVGDQKWGLTRESILAAEDVLRDYPVDLQNQHLLAGIRAAVELEDMRLATRLMEQLERGRLDPRQFALAELLAGRIDQQQERLDEAVDTYGRVISLGIAEYTTEVELYTILALDAMNRLDADRAIDSLANLALSWRGDELEAKTLNMLGQLYFRQKQYRNGFETMKITANYHADSKNVLSLQNQASLVFSSLFLDGEADRLDPVDALSLYYDFKNLTPPGARGDDMIRNLARRLVKVDLLDQASELLEYQISSRLKGAARAQIAADLAVIYIANRDPTKALQAIYRTRITNLPKVISDQRRLLEAKALIDGGRDQLALEVLAELDGVGAQMLQVDAHWSGKRYQDAAELLEKRYAHDTETVAADEGARMNLLKAAIGYTLAGDTLGLSRLRSKFSDEISRTPEWAMFDFVTSNAASSNREFRAIARDITGSNNWVSFMDSYRSRYGADGALVPNDESTPVNGLTARTDGEASTAAVDG